MGTIYLDYAAATPVDPAVLAAMQPYLADKFHNPSANYLAANRVRDDLKTARLTVSSVLGGRASEIVFTAGGTEANNLAIIGVLQAHPGSHAVSSALEHDSIRAPLAFLSERGWTHTEVAPKPAGLLDPSQVIAAINDQTVLVSVMYANNEIGTVQPIRQIAQQMENIRQARRKKRSSLPLYLHTDACQAANYLDLNVHRIGVDLMTLNGGKIYGPKQSGILFIASNVKILPLIHGGGQELNRRSGTENIAGIMGFAKALETAQSIRHEEVLRLGKLQEIFVNLLQEKITNVRVNGSLKHRLPNNVHLTIKDQDNERLIFGLDELGIQCSAGSACSASSQESSHVLKGIGLSDNEARASIRFSMGRTTTTNDINNTVKALVKLTS